MCPWIVRESCVRKASSCIPNKTWYQIQGQSLNCHQSKDISFEMSSVEMQALWSVMRCPIRVVLHQLVMESCQCKGHCSHCTRQLSINNHAGHRPKGGLRWLAPCHWGFLPDSHWYKLMINYSKIVCWFHKNDRIPCPSVTSMPSLVPKGPYTAEELRDKQIQCKLQL